LKQQTGVVAKLIELIHTKDISASFEQSLHK
jgi:hypothetical protein